MDSVTDIVERLRGPCVDWDGSDMPDAAEPLHMDCKTLREAADTITALRAGVERLRGALTNIAEATSAEDDAGENYRWDDREGALDYAYATARAALSSITGDE